MTSRAVLIQVGGGGHSVGVTWAMAPAAKSQVEEAAAARSGIAAEVEASPAPGRGVWSGFIWALIALWLAVAFSYAAITRYLAIHQSALLTQRVLENLEQVRSGLLGADSVVRNFALSGDERRLDKLPELDSRTQDEIALLGRLAADDPILRADLDGLERAVTAQSDFVRRVASAHTQGPAAALQLLERGDGRNIIGDVEDRIDRLEARELSVSRNQPRHDKLIAHLLAPAILLCCLAALAALGLAARFTGRALRGLRASLANETRGRETLVALNQKLEERVAERSSVAERRAADLEQAQKEFRRQAQLLQAILDSMREGVILCDSNLVPVQVNQAAAAIMSHTQLENRSLLQLRDTFEVLTPDSGEPLPPAEWPLMRALHGDRRSLTLRIRNRATGDEQLIESSATPLRDEQGVVRAAVAVINDVTAARANEAAAATEHQGGEFLADLSRELGAPVGAMVAELRSLLAAPLADDQRAQVRTAIAAGENVYTIVSDAAELSHLLADNYVLEPVDFDLHQVVGAALENFAAPAAQAGVELVFAVAPAVPRFLRGDADSLQRVLARLLARAVDSSERGEVVLAAALGNTTGAGVNVRFELRHGSAVKPAPARSRAFEPPADPATGAGPNSGFGALPLAIAARMVERMGGRIELRGSADEGGAVAFTLAFDRPVAPAETAADEANRLSGLRVLVADTSAANRTTVRNYLLSWGADANAVATAAAILPALCEAAAAGQGYDCVIVDPRPAEMDAPALMLAIGAEPDLKATAVVIMGEANTPELVSVVEPRLARPLKPAQLRDRMRTVLAQRHSPDERIAGTAEHNRKPLNGALTLASPDSRRRILVIEDNPVNQRLALLHVRKLGYQCEAASFPGEARERIARGDYAAVLIDCGHPDAAAEIRRCENGLHRTVVIAMAAAADEAMRNSCLASGVDDLIAKPITTETLGAALARLLPLDESADAPGLAVYEDRESLDAGVIAELRALGPGDGSDVIGELIDLFESDLVSRLETMSKALAETDGTILARASHSLKSAATGMGLVRLSLLCADLEERARGGDFRAATTLFSRIRDELEKVGPLLREQRTSTRPPTQT